MTPPSSAPDAPPSDIEASLATWLNASPHGIVVVRFDRTILWSNAAARTLEGVNLTDGVLSLFDFWSTEALADFVADLTDRPSAWCRILPSGEPLIVRGERILLGGPPILALTFRLARDHGRTVAWPDLTVAPGLSRGQAAVPQLSPRLSTPRANRHAVCRAR